LRTVGARSASTAISLLRRKFWPVGDRPRGWLLRRKALLIATAVSTFCFARLALRAVLPDGCVRSACADVGLHSIDAGSAARSVLLRIDSGARAFNAGILNSLLLISGWLPWPLLPQRSPCQLRLVVIVLKFDEAGLPCEPLEIGDFHISDDAGTFVLSARQIAARCASAVTCSTAGLPGIPVSGDGDDDWAASATHEWCCVFKPGPARLRQWSACAGCVAPGEAGVEIDSVQKRLSMVHLLGSQRSSSRSDPPRHAPEKRARRFFSVRGAGITNKKRRCRRHPWL